MTKDKKIKLFLVDDEVLFLKLLEVEFLDHGDFSIETFVSGEDCLSKLSSKPDVIILDYLLDGTNSNAMNGIDTLDKILAFDPTIPVIILSAQDSIEVAVNCMHHHAIDYVVKSETAFIRIQKIISNLYKIKKIEKELNWYIERM